MKRYYVSGYGVVYANDMVEAILAVKDLSSEHIGHIYPLAQNIYNQGYHYSPKRSLWYGSLDQPAAR